MGETYFYKIKGIMNFYSIVARRLEKCHPLYSKALVHKELCYIFYFSKLKLVVHTMFQNKENGGIKNE